MKVRSSVRKMCKDCKIIKRSGVVRVICDANKKHKQRIFDSGTDANIFYKRKAGVHAHKLTKRKKTRNKQGKINKILEEF